MKTLATELRFAVLVSLALACAMSLCGCSRAGAAQLIRTHGVLVTSVLAVLMVPVVIWQIIAGNREARERAREQKQTREAQLEDLRRLARAAQVTDRALNLALAGDWQKAHEAIATLPRGERRDTLKVAVSLLGKRAEAEQLVSVWTGRGYRWIPNQSDAPAIREATLMAASELAEALGLSLPPHVCRHPSQDADGCHICGDGFWTDEDDEREGVVP